MEFNLEMIKKETERQINEWIKENKITTADFKDYIIKRTKLPRKLKKKAKKEHKQYITCFYKPIECEDKINFRIEIK